MLKEGNIGEILRKIEKVESLSTYALMRVEPSLVLEGYSGALSTSHARQGLDRMSAGIHL
jgi:hypothetical protein